MSAHTKIYLPGLVNEDGTAAYLLATDDGDGGMTLAVGAAAAPVVTGTFSPHAMTAGQTLTIPVGAFEIGVVILTGTGTVGGVDLPLGIPWNCAGKLAATVAIVTGSPGTARVFYNT